MRAFASLFLALCVVAPVAVGQSAPNPGSAPLPAPSRPVTDPAAPASDAGLTERGLAPVQPGRPRVTTRVRNANSHDVDAQGHTLDSHGKPVGQAPDPASLPAVPSTVH